MNHSALDTHDRDAPIFAPDAFRLGNEEAALIDKARRFGARVLAPRAAQHDRDATFPIENFRDMHPEGLLRICVPKQHGGLGASLRTYCLAAAELGRYCGATALSGAADYYGILCTERAEGEQASRRNTLYLAIPANAPGVRVVGDWDPLGMRGTVSRTLLMKDVFVPESELLMPHGVYFRAATSWPHMFLTLSPTYMGLAQAAYDFTVAYLRGEVPGTPPVKRRMFPTKQIAVAEMHVMLEQTKTLWFQAVSEARANPTKEQVLRAYAAQHTVMENANALAAKAIRTCGGPAVLKDPPPGR